MSEKSVFEVDVFEMIQMTDDLRKRLLAYKNADPEVFDALDKIARSIFKSYVKHTMTTMQFIVLAGLVSLQSAEMYIKERATIECKKTDAKQV